jgi:hypothetical protein
VIRGYQVAVEVVERALAKFPNDWTLVLARAALQHDELSYRQELAKSTDFAPKRDQIFAEFQRTARLYADKAKDLSDEDQSIKPYEQWFYASLGACDLGQVTDETVPDFRQPALIAAALRALPGEASEKHRSRFANSLFTRMSSVKPAVKFRYLKGGFEIVGNDPQAVEARKVYDYYKDLVKEIELQTVLDGSSDVGHQTPFGAFVFLHHTRDIERESGGFGRYLQNQNTSTMFSWNYGRPTTDYRDRFQATATEALKEHFEILSITFETDKVHSRAAPEYGWRLTPYAYLLLKARGPQVDKLPHLRMDLDFLDTSGYVVLPIESPAVALDARADRGPPRPFRKLQITQTLDERQAGQGKLVLEVKASALGLVPDLDQLVKLPPAGFALVKTDDQGISVSKFDPESDVVAIGSERTWVLTLHGHEGSAEPARSFLFPKAKDDGASMTYQRYQDADLVNVSAEVPLEERYGERSYWWAYAGGVVAIALVVILGAGRRLLRRPAKDAGIWCVPEPLNAFSAIAFLQRIREESLLDEARQLELQETIKGLERHYFAADDGAQNGNAAPDLQDIARQWLDRGMASGWEKG